MGFYFPRTARGADEFLRGDGSWEPELHFTGSLGDKTVQGAINRHAEHLVDFYYGACGGISGSFYHRVVVRL